MEYLIGVALAVVVCAFATLAGFDRDRVFYPTLVPVVASYYVLFAVWEFQGRDRGGVPDSRRVSRAGRGRVQEEPLGDCGCPRRTRGFRLLSSSACSKPWRPGVVARLLPLLRRFRWWLLCHAADATLPIRFEDLEMRCGFGKRSAKEDNAFCGGPPAASRTNRDD